MTESITAYGVIQAAGMFIGVFAFAWAVAKWTRAGISKDIEKFIQKHKLEENPHPGVYPRLRECASTHGRLDAELEKIRDTMTLINVNLAKLNTKITDGIN